MGNAFKTDQTRLRGLSPGTDTKQAGNEDGWMRDEGRGARGKNMFCLHSLTPAWQLTMDETPERERERDIKTNASLTNTMNIV